MVLRAVVALAIVGVALAGGAGLGCDDDGGPSENAGQSCGVPDDCYRDVDPADLRGDVLCLDRVPGGYCTHHCVVDDDCCAADGECRSGFPQVCAPFESTGLRLCFLSCEGVGDEAAWCHDGAGDAFICRSTGGGIDNRKVCVPE